MNLEDVWLLESNDDVLLLDHLDGQQADGGQYPAEEGPCKVVAGLIWALVLYQRHRRQGPEADEVVVMQSPISCEEITPSACS